MQEPTTQPPTLAQLRAKREEILRVAAAHRVTNVRVFGSVAHGDAHAASDVDLIVDVPREYRGLAYFGLLADLQRALEPVVGFPVDVVSSGGRFASEGECMAEQIEREAKEL